MSVATAGRIVSDLPEAEYHSDPALSSTNARLLLDSPARYRYAQTHRRADKAEFDLGSAVHSKVLGTGYAVDVIPADLLAANGAASTAEAKQFVEKSRAAGSIPIKAETAAEVDLIAEAVLAHPMARALLEQEGVAEASVFATDDESGLEIRARFDYLAAICVDLKSGRHASEAGFAWSVSDYGYHIQQGHYLDALEIVTGERRQMVFVVVETEPPYLVGVHKLDEEFTRMGRIEAANARSILAECLANDEWPGYGSAISLLHPPMKAVYSFQDRYPNA